MSVAEFGGDEVEKFPEGSVKGLNERLRGGRRGIKRPTRKKMGKTADVVVVVDASRCDDGTDEETAVG